MRVDIRHRINKKNFVSVIILKFDIEFGKTRQQSVLILRKTLT